MKKHFLLVLTITFLIGCNKKTKNNHKKINSLFSFYENVKNSKYLTQLKNTLDSERYDTIIRNYYTKLADNYYNENKIDTYLQIYNTIEKKSTITKDTLGLIKVYCNKTFYFLTKFENDSAFYYASKAEKISKIKNETKYLDFIYNSKSSLLILKKDYIKTENYATKAIFFSLKNKNYSLTYNSYILLGNALTEQYKFNEALTYYNKALETLQQLKNEPNLNSFYGQTYNYIANLYIKKNEFKKAEEILKKGLTIDNFKKTDKNIYCYLNNNFGLVLFKTNSTVSKNHFFETLKIAKTTKNHFVQITSNLHLSEYFLKHKDFTNAVFYANNALKIASKNNLPDDKLKALLLLSKANPEKASLYFNNYKKLSDSLINFERQTLDKYTRIEYETNEIISEKENIKKENKTILQRLWSVILFSILALAFLILLFFIKQKNNKNKELQFKLEQQKANEEIYNLMLNQQQKIEEGKYSEKNRISQELHDGVMGKLTGIRLNLFILKKRQDSDTIQKCLPLIETFKI